MAAAALRPEAARQCPHAAASDRRRHGSRSNGTAVPPIAAPSVVEFPGLQTARRAEHDYRRIFLVFGRLAHLLLGQFQRNTVALVGNGAETKRAPIDDNLAAADAEESAEIDYRGADYAFAV